MSTTGGADGMAGNATSEPGGTKWAGWSRHGDGEGGHNLDTVPKADGSEKSASPLPRGRSYQENRRHERDRRDNMRRNEKKPEWSIGKKAEEGDDKKGGKRELDDVEVGKNKVVSKEEKDATDLWSRENHDKRPSRSKSDSAQPDGVLRKTGGNGGVDRKAEGDTHVGSWGEKRGDVHMSEHYSRAPGGAGTKDGAIKGHGDGPRSKPNNSSTDLMNLLKPKKADKGKTSTGYSSGSGSGGSNSSRSKAKLPVDVRLVGKSASELEAQWLKEEEERKKEKAKREAEEEEKRKEEERIREEKEQQEEAERKKREEEVRVREEELKTVTDFAREGHEKLKMKAELRETNRIAAGNRPDESFYTKLDSSLKKNTTFVRKLRNLTESQKDSLMKEFDSLNLSKYIGEAASAITEAKLKMSDVGCALHICSLMHQRYADFTKTLFENWHRILLSTKKDEKVTNPSKLRVDLRFFADLITVGVFKQKEGLPLLANQLILLIGNDKDDHSNLPILLSFCRHCGDDYAGLLSRKHRLLSAKYDVVIPRSKMLPAERQKACRHLLKEYYSSLCRHLLRDHDRLRNKERQNRKILQTKGELSEDQRDKFEGQQTAFHKLVQNTSLLADLLDEPLPELPEDDKMTDSDGCGLDIFSTLKGAEYQYDGDTSLFEDDDTRQFYETLPDLKAIIPGILYKDSEHSATAHQQQKQADKVDEELEENLDVEELEKEMEVLEEGGEKETTGEEGKVAPEEDVAPSDVEMTATDVEDEEGDVGSSMKVILEAYLAKLPNCVNRELIDKSAIEFCMSLNTKANRKKLVRALFTVQRTRYDLLPFYSRLVATLTPCMPDLANELVMLLRSDFRWHVRKKDQINIESKLKTVRFIGELAKFNVFPKADALLCLKMLMFDFSHHNIEMACALLESSGRFLYRSHDSHHRTKVYLDVMMRKKAALHLDSRYTTMIENAFYYSNPPDVKMETHKERPPMHEYIRRLLYRDLSKVTTEKVLRQMRKLNWDDSEISAYACKCMTAIWNLRYNSIHCCANLLAGLARYHETFAIQVVDGVLEDTRLGMEINHPKYNQRRVSTAKYLGELYNYRLLESSVIFKTLYSFITFGVNFDEENPSLLDPPEHLFRLRLVCVVLDTCGQYFDRGSSKKKLDCFLVYFQRYYWYKRSTVIWSEMRPFPIDIDYMVQEAIETLRPTLHLCESYDEAAEAADQLDTQFRAKLAEVFANHPDGDDGVDTEEEYALPTIHESDEMDELSQGGGHRGGHRDGHRDDDGGTQDSEMDGETTTGSHSQHADDLTVECEIVDDDDDDLNLDSAGEEDDDDHQVAVLAGGLKHLKCSEDDDFMTAFDTMVTENIQARNQESVKVPQFDIAVPVHLKSQQKPKGLPLPGFPEEEPLVISSTIKSSVNFVLMTRKGNRQQFSNLNVPISAEFATKFKEREQAERAEKERMKRVVLDIHERQEEEDYQEMLVSLTRPAAANMNRERKVRYQHPKGAPDADLIFGSKKR